MRYTFIHPRSLDELQTQVGLWSRANHGAYISIVDTQLHLGPLIPLLNIGVYLSLYEGASTVEREQDALADALISLCDFASRDDFRLANIMSNPEPHSQPPSLGVSYGRLLQTITKRHSGVDGLDRLSHYMNLRKRCVHSLASSLTFTGRRFVSEEVQGMDTITGFTIERFASIVITSC